MKYYFDIWRDYAENRSDKFRPLGDWAFRLIQKIISEESTFLFSPFVMKELRGAYSDEKINRFLAIIPEGLLVNITPKQSQIEEAHILGKKFNLPRGDALHAILARDSGSILVTRDRHFLFFADQVEIKKPEDLI